MQKPFFGVLALVLLFCRPVMSAGDQTVLPLWSRGAPGPKASSQAERDMTTPNDHIVAGKPVIRLGNISDPTLTVYAPSSATVPRPTVLVFPGGGYRILAIDLEGTEVCRWLNSIGLTAILVKYRVPEPEGTARYAQPLQDAERAISLVRHHAQDWGVDPKRVGVLGFSAGGHLAAVLNNAATNDRTYPKQDDADSGSLRPAFTLLIYPAYLSVNDAGEELAPEVAPSNHTPPTFIVQAEDDHVFVEGTLLYYRALKRANVPGELHIFPKGGHGYGLRQSEDRVTEWPELARAWLHGLGVM